ncbi:hypothetical protein G6F57_021911 [Rhizopus arrhizus]|nr:hypothetical protein G6F57_021911 [Rhizopus arrhizus]
MPGQAIARPDLSPRIARDEILEVRIQRGAVAQGALHVRVAEHLTPDFQPRLIAVMLVHDLPPSHLVLLRTPPDRSTARGIWRGRHPHSLSTGRSS